MVKILGIDPGLQKTGWGIIISEGNSLKYVACGTIKTSPDSAVNERLHELHQGLEQVLEQFRPEQVAMEETFVNKNALSSLKLGHARGAMMITISLAKIPLTEYASTKIKKSITGVGRAEKEQIEAMVKMLLPQSVINGPDEADALAIAICHAHHMSSALNMCIA